MKKINEDMGLRGEDNMAILTKPGNSLYHLEKQSADDYAKFRQKNKITPEFSAKCHKYVKLFNNTTINKSVR